FHTSNALFFYPDCPRGAPVFPYTTLFRSPELRVLRLAELEMFAPDPVESALRPPHVDPADQDCTDSTCQEEEEERPTRRARVSFFTDGLDSDDFMRGLQQPELPIAARPEIQKYVEYFSNDPKGRKMFTSWLRRS